MPGSTRVVDLPVYLSASLTRLCPFVGLTRDAADSSAGRGSPRTCCAPSARLHPTAASAYGSFGPLRGQRRLNAALCDAALERDSGTPSVVGSGGAGQAGSRPMDKPEEGGTPGPRGRPKTAPRQIASTPKRATAQAERRLRAQSFTAAATSDSDTAQEAIREALPSQPEQAAAGGDGRGSDEQPFVAPRAAAAAGPGPAAAQDQESPITSRQRRAPGTGPARAAGGAAAKSTGRVPAHHDRRGHVPPADHHAEAQTGALPPPETAASADGEPTAARPAARDSKEAAKGAPEAASDETRDAPAAPRGGGRKGRSATERSDGSAERRDGLAAEQGAAAAQHQPQQQQQQQPEPPPKGAAGAAKVAGSLFSPVFSLFGGKPASEVPPQPGDEEAGVRNTGEGTDRRTVDISARPASGGAKGDSSADVARPADDDVHSENDTQIRVPSGQSSGSQARACTSPCSYAHK